MSKILIKNIASGNLNAPPEISCIGKVRFRNMKSCVNAVKTIKKNKVYKYRIMDTNAYHCQYCDGWHLGNKPKGLFEKN